jgi:predicted ABC-type transport system involved in lysophospholipase L1 biosynthesis ATPase subunit
VIQLLDIVGVSKDYRGLRPLRIQQLSVAAAESVALVGFDQIAAEVFVNLATGATLPDAGSVRVFGRPTSEITTPDDWLRIVDRFGIVSERAVLLESLTALQNLAMPFTLDVEPLADAAREQAEALAAEVALAAECWHQPIAVASADAQMRVRFGRALALGPELILLEHASARLERNEKLALGASMKRVAARRGIGILALTADGEFARAVASRVLHWEPASGRLTERRHWSGRLLGWRR